MSATAHLMLVPRDRGFVPRSGTAREIAVALHAKGAFFLSEFTEHPPVPPPELADNTATSFRLQPRDLEVPIARFFDSYTPFSIVVGEFRVPTDVTDDLALRHCRSCGALVETLARCAVCGVEEDPSEWRLGPGKVIYTRALELGLVAEGGLDIWTKTDREVEYALREYFGTTLLELEGRLRIPFQLIRFVGP